MYKTTEKCRICGNKRLERVLDLGEQMLTGVFPREKGVNITKGPLHLVKCMGGDEVCGLLQLEHSYDSGEMYGENYGYRSGLNPSMVAHLHGKVKRILAQVELRQGDLIVDIGSNDGTTLQAYPSSGPILVGIDPTGVKFRDYYPPHIQLIPDFFSSALLKEHFPKQKAKVITSFSMFYDLEDPMDFMRQVHDVLADDGIWVFEQSYMPTMLETNSYDTVCHEHLEFYALRQIKWMTDQVGLRIVDMEFNDVNGGSFSVTVSKANGDLSVAHSVQTILDQEQEKGLCTLEPYKAFAKRVEKTRNDFLEFLKTAHSQGKTVAAIGASTKGNVLLQYCGITDREVTFVGEVNTEKYGCYTPGSWIPVIPEEELFARKPDYLIVLPWHFKEFFLTQQKYKQFNLVFPLPNLEVVNAHSEMIERITHHDSLLAVIIRKDYRKDGISFITPNDFSLQLGYMNHPERHEIKPHMHHPIYRETVGTQEVLIIQKGKIRIDFYSFDKEYLENRELSSGDVILLLSAGHGMTVLEPVSMIEVKNGPYRPQEDKEKFERTRHDTS